MVLEFQEKPENHPKTQPQPRSIKNALSVTQAGSLSSLKQWVQNGQTYQYLLYEHIPTFQEHIAKKILIFRDFQPSKDTFHIP